MVKGFDFGKKALISTDEYRPQSTAVLDVVGTGITAI
jgi:hypothetical protein